MQSTDLTASEKKAAEALCTAKSKRDPDKIRQAMLKTTGIDKNSEPEPLVGGAMSVRDRDDIGLTLRELEDDRWNVSPTVAKELLVGVGLPYEGRRAGLIYSWASIFRAEGVEDQIAKSATKNGSPQLYDNLLDTSAAAELLGFKDASSIRKLAGSGDIPKLAFIKFGARGVYRFRPGFLLALRKASTMARIV